MGSSAANPVAGRVRFLACGMGIVFLLAWGSWFWPFDDLLDRQGTPLGADFSMFFVAGQLAADGDFEQLYHQAEHQRRLHGLFPSLSPEFCLPFRYPPAVALSMATLANLPYPTAWAIFTLFSVAAFGLALWLLDVAPSLRDAGPSMALGSASRRDATTLRKTAMWACLGWPVALEVLIGGQASMFAFAIATVSTLLLTKNYQVLAGAILALSAYKPNVLALFAVGIAVRYPRVLLGALPVGAAWVGVSSFAGYEPLQAYVNLTLNLASQAWDVETPFWKMHSLAPWLNWIVPGRGRAVTTVLGLSAAVAVAVWWRRADGWSPSARPIALSGLLVVNAIFNPYTPIYDLVLLALAAYLMAGVFQTDHRVANVSPHVVQVWLAGLFFGPHLSQAVAKPLGFQLFPLLLAGISVWVLAKTVVHAARVQPNRTLAASTTYVGTSVGRPS
jgi:hypothetical protein